MHVPISKPKNDSISYYNRKRFCSIIWDFINIITGNFMSTTKLWYIFKAIAVGRMPFIDADVWLNNSLAKAIANDNIRFPFHFHLLLHYFETQTLQLGEYIQQESVSHHSVTIQNNEKKS